MGNDPNGQFTLQGTCDPAGTVIFTKQYTGKHAVAYSGKLTGNTINGKWMVSGQTGPFLIQKQAKPWKGHFVQDGKQTEMSIEHLNIFNRLVTGSGSDAVGLSPSAARFSQTAQSTL